MSRYTYPPDNAKKSAFGNFFTILAVIVTVVIVAVLVLILAGVVL